MNLDERIEQLELSGEEVDAKSVKQLIRDVLEYVKPRPVYKLNGKKYIFSENTANYMNAKIKDLGL